MSTCCRGHGLDVGGAATVVRPLAVLTPGGLVESTQEHRTREGMRGGGLLGEGCLVIRRSASARNGESRTAAGGGVFSGEREEDMR